MSGPWKVVGRSEKGGHVTVRMDAVHAHECGYWRFGTRHRPCSCDALAMLDELLAMFAVTAQCPTCGAEVDTIEFLPDVRAFIGHKTPSGRTCNSENNTPAHDSGRSEVQA